MNGTIDSPNFTQGSKYQDCFVGDTVYSPPNFPEPWSYFQRINPSTGIDFEHTPKGLQICLDEINPREYNFQTSGRAAAWVSGLVVPVLVCVEWGFNDETARVVEAMIAADTNNFITWVQEFYYFGEDGTHSDFERICDWYQSHGVITKVAACYIISNNYLKSVKYARACSYNPGAKSAYDRQVMHRLASVGSFSAFLWGCDLTYRHPVKDALPGQPIASHVWDENLVAVYAQYGIKHSLIF